MDLTVELKGFTKSYDVKFTYVYLYERQGLESLHMGKILSGDLLGKYFVEWRLIGG